MADDKKIIIGGKTVLYGTSVKASPELKSSSTSTFSGAITSGLGDVSWTVEIERVRYDKKTTHQELSQLLESMFDTPRMVSIRETVRPKGEDPYTVIDNYHGCIVSDNSYEIKADDHTVESLKFIASRRSRVWK